MAAPGVVIGGRKAEQAALAARQAWLAERKHYLGGSDAAAVVGQDPWRTPLDVYNDKLGLSDQAEPSGHMRRGIKLEAAAAAEYEQVTGRMLWRRPTQYSREYPFLAANVDRIVVGAGTRTIVEIKCPSVGTFARFKREGIPSHYQLQAQHYLAVTGYEAVEFAVFSAEQWELLPIVRLERDDRIIAELLAAEIRFWQQHIIARVPPSEPPVVLADLPPVGGSIVQREDEPWREAVAQYREATRLAEQADILKSVARDTLRELAGDVGVYEGAGVRAYFNVRPGRTTFDRKALARAHPELDLAAFERQGAPYNETRIYQLRAHDGDLTDE